jgi:signal transduction histidine kinase
MQRASELARRSLGDARRSIRALRARALEEGNLCIALEGATRQAVVETELVAEFATVGKPRPLPEAVEENMLRIHQELLTNVLRHSGAMTVTATLSFDSSAVSLEVRDDGHGFDPGTANEGLGLIGIRERTAQMRGTLTIDSRNDIGTRVTVSIPDPVEPGTAPS